MSLDHVGCLLNVLFVFISFLSPFKFHWATPSVIGSQNEKPFVYLIIQFEPLFFLHHFLNVLISFLIIFFLIIRLIPHSEVYIPGQGIYERASIFCFFLNESFVVLASPICC